VWPETKEQRDWVPRLGNVLDKLPKRLQGRAKEQLREIMYAETRDAAKREVQCFCGKYGAKYPKAVASLTRDPEKLFTFFDFPAEHWKHIRTTNVIESTFATVRLRQRVTKGAGSRTKGMMMVYKLLAMAQKRWRRLDGYQLLPLVRAGATFKDGVLVEREDTEDRKEAA
jgi:transposase-like protein